MLPSRSCHSHSIHKQQQHLAGSRPLMALRQLNMRNRQTRHTGSSQCAATANKAPELTPKEQQLLQCMLNYEYTVDLPDGQLVIQPLRERWLQRTGDLLADTFVDAKGIQPYRRYVRRNIGKYLDQHINMPPAAVVITAVLRTQVEGSPSTDLGLHDLQTAAGADSDSSSSSSSGNSSSKDADKPSSSNSSSSSSAGEADADQARPLGMALGQFMVKRFGWLIKPNTPETRVTDGFSSSSSSGLSSVEIEGINVGSEHATTRSSSSSSGAADAYAAITSTDTARSSSNKAQDSNSSSSSQAAGPNVASLVGSALQRLSDSVSLQQLRLQHKASQTHVVETLVGVAEVSFRERTRSQALTLNPPQKCGYLCNMAVGKEWRRRGIASQLMTAVEDMCLLAGEADLYLHLRFKDEATAGSLYRKHGFVTAKKDCWLLLLVGQEPRFLMLKQLAADRMLAGKVALPGFKQGVTAAELQQEQDQQQQQQQQDEAVGGGAGEGAAGGQSAAAPAASPAA